MKHFFKKSKVINDGKSTKKLIQRENIEYLLKQKNLLRQILMKIKVFLIIPVTFAEKKSIIIKISVRIILTG